MQSIIGHERVLEVLEGLVGVDRLAHAYLLCGPHGVGKTTIAVWLAQRLLCAAELPPCQSCNTCTHVARWTHPDVQRIGDGAALGVDDVRAWTAALSSSTLFAGWKIGIVVAGEMMSESAANACLKTIEEPTSKTVIIITTTAPHAVLPTISSRCALMRCHRVPSKQLKRALEARGVDTERARRITRIAHGCPGRAIAFASESDVLEQISDQYEGAERVLHESIGARMRYVDDFIKAQPKDAAEVKAQCISLVRIFRHIARDRIREKTDAFQYMRWIQAIAQAPALLSANVKPKLILESILLTHP